MPERPLHRRLTICKTRGLRRKKNKRTSRHKADASCKSDHLSRSPAQSKSFRQDNERAPFCRPRSEPRPRSPSASSTGVYRKCAQCALRYGSSIGPVSLVPLLDSLEPRVCLIANASGRALYSNSTRLGRRADKEVNFCYCAPLTARVTLANATGA